MKDMIDYFKTMITPPVEDALVLVAKPSEIAYAEYIQEFLEEGELVPTREPMVHGVILLEEPTDEESKQLLSILKPGGHVVLIPVDPIGYKGVIALEDTGFEVRDAIFVAEEPDTFHYTSKASRSEREEGLDTFDEKVTGMSNGALTEVDAGEAESEGLGHNKQIKRKNTHPTVKPIEIMEWCARDIEPNSKVVDPFLGSGTTGIAMSRLGHDFVGVELNKEYAELSEARIRHWMPIGTEINSEAQVGKAEPAQGGQVSIFDIFG